MRLLRWSNRLIVAAFVLVAVPVLWAANSSALGVTATMTLNGQGGNVFLPCCTANSVYNMEGHVSFDTVFIGLEIPGTCYTHAGMPWAFARSGVPPHQSGGNYYSWSTNGYTQNDAVTGELSYVFSGNGNCAGKFDLYWIFNQYVDYSPTNGTYVSGSGTGHQFDSNARVYAFN